MLVLGAPVYAQDDGYEDSGRLLEEVIITAQKREQTLQEVPVTVSAFSGEFITENGVQDIRDIAGLTPNLSIKARGETEASVFIRGIGSQAPGIGADPAVGIFIDGMVASRGTNATAAFFDVERIEVVKGPQGTLFGRNASAGAISIITKMSTNAELLERRQQAVARSVFSSTPVFAARAKNAELWDADGKRYIDFALGIAVCNTGHCHPKIMAAAKEQCDLFTHTAFQVVAYETYIALAERLNKLAPMEDAKSLFFSTGAEAVENAIKVARIATGRQGVIAFKGAFHGRTALASALTGKIVPYKAGGGIPVPGIFHAPFPVPHHGISVEDALLGLETLFKVDIEAKDVAAIIVEPVQGEGGFYPAPAEFLQAIRAICDEHGIVMVCDEIQTGFGRTGKIFAIEHSGKKAATSPILKKQRR